MSPARIASSRADRLAKPNAQPAGARGGSHALPATGRAASNARDAPERGGSHPNGRSGECLGRCPRSSTNSAPIVRAPDSATSRRRAGCNPAHALAATCRICPRGCTAPSPARTATAPATPAPAPAVTAPNASPAGAARRRRNRPHNRPRAPLCERGDRPGYLPTSKRQRHRRPHRRMRMLLGSPRLNTTLLSRNCSRTARSVSRPSSPRRRRHCKTP